MSFVSLRWCLVVSCVWLKMGSCNANHPASGVIYKDEKAEIVNELYSAMHSDEVHSAMYSGDGDGEVLLQTDVVQRALVFPVHEVAEFVRHAVASGAIDEPLKDQIRSVLDKADEGGSVNDLMTELLELAQKSRLIPDAKYTEIKSAMSAGVIYEGEKAEIVNELYSAMYSDEVHSAMYSGDGDGEAPPQAEFVQRALVPPVHEVAEFLRHAVASGAIDEPLKDQIRSVLAKADEGGSVNDLMTELLELAQQSRLIPDAKYTEIKSAMSAGVIYKGEKAEIVDELYSAMYSDEAHSAMYSGDDDGEAPLQAEFVQRPLVLPVHEVVELVRHAVASGAIDEPLKDQIRSVLAKADEGGSVNDMMTDLLELAQRARLIPDAEYTEIKSAMSAGVIYKGEKAEIVDQLKSAIEV